MDAAKEIEEILRTDGQLSPAPARLTPLGGGVSCEIFKVEQDGNSFVVKRALPKLKVKAEWLADVGRNAVEHAFFETMAKPLAGSVPRVYFHNAERGYFTMECLEDGWCNWKELLLKGTIAPAHGALAGALLGRIHATTWQDAKLRGKFDTTSNFRELRADPYLRATAQQRPEVETILLAEADRLESCRVCLVHGDFSPKNLLIKDTQMAVLDAEVAWFGEPAFDVAFLMTHFFLKGLYHHSAESPWQETALAARAAYFSALEEKDTGGLEARCAHLLSAILLARVDGKSPVEYLSPAKQEVVRAFTIETLRHPLPDLPAMIAAWQNHLSQTP